MDEAELSLRRGLIILLRPTALSGYPHPKLRGGFDRYRKILLEMSLSEEEIDRRFKELGKEAGFDAESYDRLLRSMGTQ
jgi:hypothetical protein